MSGGPRVWRAQAQDAEDVARLLIAFRDWFEGDAPSEAAMRTMQTAMKMALSRTIQGPRFRLRETIPQPNPNPGH